MLKDSKTIIFLLFTLIVIFISSIGYAFDSDIVYKINLSGEIDPGLVSFVERGIKEAEDAGASLIIFELDSYGGLVDSGIKIKDLIFASQISTVGFIKGRAWSAAALISLSSEKLVMSTGSSIGAAETRPNDEKYISALRKEFKATAERRGKNSELAAAMVDADIEIEGIIASGKLLTLTTEEAIKNDIADYKVNNINELLNVLGFSSSKIVEIRAKSSEKFARIVTRPAVSGVLLSIAFIGLIFEALTPGWGVGGTIGLVSLGTFFSAYIINGVANWGLVVLFIVGLILISMEIFIVPGFGITGIGGLMAIFSSLFFLFPTANIALTVLATVLFISILATIVIIKFFGASRFWKRIALGESQTKERGYVVQIDKETLIAKKGKVLSPLRPAGIIEIDGERLDVVSEGDFIESGQIVEIIKISGNRIVVKKKEEE